MATKLNGSKIFLQATIGGDELFVVCEQTSELSVSAEGVEVRCKTTGEFAEQLDGGSKTGTISFTGAYVKDPAVNEASFETLFDQVGNVLPFVWGGTEPGDFIVECNAKITDLSITANQDEAVTFSLTLTISEQPILTTVST